MSLVAIAAVLSTMHFEGDVSPAGGDYVDVGFPVPAGTVEIQISHTDGSPDVILDWGVWGPDGFRGWGGGLTDDVVIGVDQSSRSYLPGPIKEGTWTVVIGKAKIDPTTGGHYSIDVTCRDNATLPVLVKASYAPVVISTERRWYKGDFHVHSIQSGDAAATFDQISTLAKSRGLDFVNVSDHNTTSQHDLLAAIQASTTDFLFLRGAEITTYSGHGNAVGLHDYVDHRLGYAGRTMQNIVDDVAAQGALFIVNHPKLDLGNVCIGCDWKHLDDTPWDKVAGIEVITGNWEIGIQAFVPRVLAMWDDLLNQGYKIAAIGGSDDHTAGMSHGQTDSQIGSPTTLVLSDGLSEAAIMDAIRAGRTIVQLRGPDDPFVEMTVKKKDGSIAEIGDEVYVDHLDMTIHVVGGNGTFVQVWFDGKKATQIPVTSDDFTTKYGPAAAATRGVTAAPAPNRYRLELVTDANQRIVVTSHIIVHEPGGPDVAGCGCRSGGDRGGFLLVLVAFALSAHRAQRRQRATEQR
jgi:MYXO-CTERM domain-containing protein